jgi:hypothetical protein
MAAEETAAGRRKRVAWFVGKLAISASLIAWVLARADLAVVGERARGAAPLAASLAVAAIVMQWPLTARRWQLLARSLGAPFPLSSALRIQLGAQLMSQTVPTLGGDAWRVLAVRRAGHSLRIGALAVVADRIAALAGVVALAALGAVWMAPRLADAPDRSLLLLALGGAALGVALALVADRILPARLAWIGGARRALLRAGGASIAAISLLVPALSGVAVWSVARAYRISVELGDCIALVPSITLLAALPISIAGWGVREGSAIFVLSLVGVRLEDALLLALTLGMLQLLTALPGALFLKAERA